MLALILLSGLLHAAVPERALICRGPHSHRSIFHRAYPTNLPKGFFVFEGEVIRAEEDDDKITFRVLRRKTGRLPGVVEIAVPRSSCSAILRVGDKGRLVAWRREAGERFAGLHAIEARAADDYVLPSDFDYSSLDRWFK